VPSSRYHTRTHYPPAAGRVLFAWLLSLAAVAAPAFAQHATPTAAQEHAQPPADGQAPEGAQHGTAEEAHEAGVFPVIAKLINFAILAGVLVYFLRLPVADYLQRRGRHIREDLVNAAQMRATAESELAEIDRRMQALPRELEELRERGRREAAAEEARIRELAENERQRLIEQTRREIDLQVRVARRDLTRHAAELAVAVAADRIRRQITPDDQVRLIDRYTSQVQLGAAQ
jgi:F-type H+-transporting ATPase subunit b